MSYTISHTMSYVTISYVDIRHRTYIRCRIRYGPTILYVMYIRHRTSISDILVRHCVRYAEMKTYDVVCVTYDVVCWRATSYVTYDVARTMSYVYILYIARTRSYVRCSTPCRMSHVRCCTCMTYNIVRDVRHSRWQESRCFVMIINRRARFHLESVEVGYSDIFLEYSIIMNPYIWPLGLYVWNIPTYTWNISTHFLYQVYV